MQAEMHYKGKKHAKVMYLKRCRESKIGPVKNRDSTLAEIETSTIWTPNTPPDDDLFGSPVKAEALMQVQSYNENTITPISTINTNAAVPNSTLHSPTHFVIHPLQNHAEPRTPDKPHVIGYHVSEPHVTHCQNTLESTEITTERVLNSDRELELEKQAETETESKISDEVEIPQREAVILPDPLPIYIKKIEKPAVLKESLRCTVCDIYVNSDNQMKQHVNSLRHKNIEQGIPTPPKPNKEDKPKTRAEQFRCEVCRVTLNSDIQLLQHLSSQRHKNMLEGRPPKPRWTPYERTQHALLRSATQLRLTLKTIPSNGSPLLLSPPNLSIAAQSQLHQSLLAPTAPTHMKQTAFITPDGSILQTREIVYIGAGGQAFTAPFQQQQLTARQMLQPTHIQQLPPTELQPLINTQCFDPRKLNLDWNV